MNELRCDCCGSRFLEEGRFAQDYFCPACFKGTLRPISILEWTEGAPPQKPDKIWLAQLKPTFNSSDKPIYTVVYWNPVTQLYLSTFGGVIDAYYFDKHALIREA
jgi:hypothetical protein